MKKKAIILAIVCLVILIGALILDKVLSKNYFQELKYNQVVEKIENKESFVLLVSQTECSHCLTYKPKLENVANDEKLYIYYIDVDLLSDDERNELKEYFTFSGTPTTIFFINGEEKTAATRINGDASQEKILRKLESNGFID